MSLKRDDLNHFFEQLLDVGEFNDYGPNGLQVEGAEWIKRIAFAVSATAHSIRVAAESGAQALVVHHGLFWSFHGPKTLTGPFARRVFPLVRHDINLFAYHLPLDAHLDIGNAACLAKRLGVTELAAFGDHQGSPTGVRGCLVSAWSALELQHCLAEVLDHPVMLATPDAHRRVSQVGIITGGANRDWILAARAGLDAYITGEMSEHDWHESQEAGLHMLAGGHHATEQFGIQALMARVSDHFGVECFFIPSENPA
jgi:dinuclear metal center YbgI/SA1388 family protein